MIKVLVSIVLALGIASAAYAAADGLDIDNNPFAQTGGTDDLKCDEAVQAYMTSEGFPPTVDTVTIAGISSDCIGANIKVILTDDGSPVGEAATGTITDDDNKVLDFSGQGVSFLDVNDLHIVIQGGSAPAP